MNTFSKTTSITKANIIQSVFFSLCHLLPWLLIYFVGGEWSDIPWSYLAVQLPYCIFFGCISGRIFYHTHSLWTVAIIHCFNDVIGKMMSNAI